MSASGAARRRPPTIPLCIYMLWHPECRDGMELARAVHGWFHAPSSELFRAGLGVPVYYRSRPWDAADARPRPIDCRSAQLNVVVPLVDHNMVSDPAWQEYLAELATAGAVSDALSIFPVALHESAFRLTDEIRKINYLPVDSRDDPTDGDAAARLRRRARRLRRRLTEVCGRLIQGRLWGADSGGAPPPLTLFLSHAKVDGTRVAAELKARILEYGQIRAYYDENDLPIGHAFASELERAASSDSAAMISVLTDAYAKRPWCRKEVSLARSPRLESQRDDCWAIQPLLVVDALQLERTRSMPELGNAPIIRWQPERVNEILDMLLLEVLLNSFHRLRALAVPRREGRAVISWVPDVVTVLDLTTHDEASGMSELVYPGHGLSPYEVQAFARLFPRVEMRTFEEASR